MTPPAFPLPLVDTAVPQDQAGLAEAIVAACRSGTAVYPIGGGTNLALGVRPTKPGIGLSTACLNRLIDFPARDLTITVEAGMTVADLARRLAAENQRLPVDVPCLERATVGGSVAANVFGPGCYRWGTLRDYVLGFSAVDGRGTVFCGGGRVVKNAAGYNMGRLMVGSLGTLGVITQVTLMVRPIPEAAAIVACEVADPAASEPLLADLVARPVLPSAIELLLGPAWQTVPHLPALSRPSGTRLLVGLEGTRDEVDWMVAELERRWRELRVAPVTTSGPARDELWQRLTEAAELYPSAVAEEQGNGAGFLLVQANVLPGRVAEAAQALRYADTACSIQAHAGNGILRARLALRQAAQAARLCLRVRTAIQGLGGSLVVLRYPADAPLVHESIWGPPGEGRQVMQAIKRQFDPQGILNPGRL